jgi:hypothetical protein
LRIPRCLQPWPNLKLLLHSLSIAARSLEGFERQNYHCQSVCHLAYRGKLFVPGPGTDCPILRFVIHAVRYHARTHLRRRVDRSRYCELDYEKPFRVQHSACSYSELRHLQFTRFYCESAWHFVGNSHSKNRVAAYCSLSFLRTGLCISSLRGSGANR